MTASTIDWTYEATIARHTREALALWRDDAAQRRRSPPAYAYYTDHQAARWRRHQGGEREDPQPHRYENFLGSRL